MPFATANEQSAAQAAIHDKIAEVAAAKDAATALAAELDQMIAAYNRNKVTAFDQGGVTVGG